MQRKRITVDTGVIILEIYTGLLLIAEFATTRNLKTGMIAHGCIPRLSHKTQDLTKFTPRIVTRLVKTLL